MSIFDRVMLPENPEFVRFWHYALRKKNYAHRVLVCAGAMLAIWLYNMWSHQVMHPREPILHFVRLAYLETLGLTLFVSLIASSMPATASTQLEFSPGQIELLRLTGYSPQRFAMGKVLSLWYRGLLFLFVSFPFTFAATILGAASVFEWFFANLIIALVVASFTALSSLPSLVETDKKKAPPNKSAILPIGALLAQVLIMCILFYSVSFTGTLKLPLSDSLVGCFIPIGAICAVLNGDVAGYRIAFFGRPISGVLMTIGCQIMLFCVATHMLARHIAHDEKPILSKRLSLIVAVFVFVFIAGGCPFYYARREVTLLAGLLFFATTLISILSIERYRDCLVWMRAHNRTTSFRERIFGEGAPCNGLTILMGTIALAVFFFTIAFVAPSSLTKEKYPFFLLACRFFVAILCVASVCKLATVIRFSHPRLMAAIVLVGWSATFVLPPILSVIASAHFEALGWLCPIGSFPLFEDSWRGLFAFLLSTLFFQILALLTLRKARELEERLKKKALALNRNAEGRKKREGQDDGALTTDTEDAPRP